MWQWRISAPEHGTWDSFFFFFSSPVLFIPSVGWFTWPLSTVSQLWHSAASLSCPERCWRSKMIFSRYVDVIGRRWEEGRCCRLLPG